MPTQEVAPAKVKEGDGPNPEATSKNSDNKPNSPANASASKPKAISENQSATKTNKRRRLPEVLPHPTHPTFPKSLYNDDIMTKEQSIEMIAQKEALHHVEMAWKAQQRLVRRCLGLRLFGEPPQSADQNGSDSVGKESNTAA